MSAGGEGNIDLNVSRSALRAEMRGESLSADALARADDQSIVEWLSGLSQGYGEIQVAIHRLEPKMYKGRKAAGWLETISEMIDLDDLRQRWGGGKYSLRVMRRAGQGAKMVFAGARQVDIVGPPILLDDPNAEPKDEHLNADTPVIQQAVSVLRQTAEEERRRAATLEQELRTNGMNGANTAIEALLDAQKQSTSMLERVLLDRAAPKEPETRPTDKLLEKMIEGESARISALKAQHESEIRVLRAAALDDVKRAEDRADRMIAAATAAHEREIRTNDRLHADSMKHLELGMKAEINSLERENRRLLDEVSGLKKEIAELRAKKDVPLVEQLSNIVQIREALEQIGGGKEEEEKGSAVERIAETIFNSPVAQGIADRLSNPPPGGVPMGPMGPMVPPGMRPVPGQPGQRPLVRRPPGAPGAPAPAGPPPLRLEPAQVEMAVKSLEQAARNGTEPEQYAVLARSVVPPDILKAIRVRGIDFFLEEVVKIKEGDYLSTMQGRTFARKVAKILAGAVPAEVHAPAPMSTPMSTAKPPETPPVASPEPTA